MTITSSPDDKFAFLFTGPTNVDRFIRDIENVVDVLTEYYNYPAGNITVVHGPGDPPLDVPDGVNTINIENKHDFKNELEIFLEDNSDPDRTVLLYFTGGGDNTNGPKLLIDGSEPSSSNVVDPTWLKDRLSTFSGGYLNVVMQQSYSGGFLSALEDSSQWSFTCACSESEDSWGTGTEGS